MQCKFNPVQRTYFTAGRTQTVNTVSPGATSARQSLRPPSIVGFNLRREMRVKVAVHFLLRNHSVAESTFIRTAALKRHHLCPHVNRLTQLRAPEGLRSKTDQRKQYIICAPNNPYNRAIKACQTSWLSRLRKTTLSSQPHA